MTGSTAHSGSAREGRRWAIWLVSGVAALVIMAFFWSVSEPPVPLGDFRKAYYPAGALVRADPAALYQFPPKFNCIPIVAWLFVPLSWLSEPAAGAVFTLVGALAVGLTCYGLIQLIGVAGWRRAALAGLFVVNGPLYNGLREGNLTHFVLFLLFVALHCMEQRRDAWAGALLAIAGILKPPVLLVAGLLVLRWRLGALAGFGGALLGIGGASLALYGLELHVAWYRDCVQPFVDAPIGAFNAQSVDGFLARLLTDGRYLHSWWPIANLGPGFVVLKSILVALLVCPTAWVLWRTRRAATATAQRLDFSILLCLALLISPTSWTHYYLLLLLPIGLQVGGMLGIPAGRRWSALFWLAVALISPPVTAPTPGAGALHSPMASVLVSHYFFGGVLMLAVLLCARRSGQTKSAVGSHGPASARPLSQGIHSQTAPGPGHTAAQRPSSTPRASFRHVPMLGLFRDVAKWLVGQDRRLSFPEKSPSPRSSIL
jgi:hypothetical protein